MLINDGNSNHFDGAPMEYTAIFHCCENDNFQMKQKMISFLFSPKHRLWVHVRTSSVRRFLRVPTISG